MLRRRDEKERLDVPIEIAEFRAERLDGEIQCEASAVLLAAADSLRKLTCSHPAAEQSPYRTSVAQSLEEE